MTHQEFIEEVRKAYIKARECSYQPKINSGILRRGTSHTISSISEDIFAAYCAEKAIQSNCLEIIVDPQISFKGTGLRNINDKKSLLIRPDVAICKNEKIICLFDLKMDLGFSKAGFISQAIARNLQIDVIKNNRATINGKSYCISQQVEFIYLLLSEKNNLKGLHSHMSTIQSLENIDIFLLSSGDHLNAYHDNPIFKPNVEEFERLDCLLAKHLN
jgi:hypothetical protein